MKAFPKIFHVGDRWIKDIFNGEVEITEKIDGCVSIDNKILLSDLTYKRAGDLKIGDKLIGFGEDLNDTRFKESVVTCAKIIKKECFEITMSDGKKIIASKDHPWVIRKRVHGSIGKTYIKTEELKPGLNIVDLGYWEHINTWESGYIAGQYDGEGSLVGRSERNTAVMLGYTQKECPQVEYIYNMLIDLKFQIRRYKQHRKEHYKIIDTLMIKGGWAQILRFLGVFRPKRLLEKAPSKVWDGSPMNGVKHNSVVKITPVGIKRVMGLSTSTKTYIVEGLLCHNSQFCFGKINGELKVRSKGKEMVLEAPEKMFSFIVSYVKTLDLPDNMMFYGEYLSRPKHNTLEYERIPKHYFVLFGISINDEFIDKHEELKKYAERLDVDCVPLLFKGKIEKEEDLFKLLDTMSFLGKSKVEGVVIKRYEPIMIGSEVIPVMAAKFVSEAFKEKHTSTWKSEHTGVGKWGAFQEGYRTEARWNKAIQHLKEKGELTESPKDIGNLIKEIQEDISLEEKENIKDFLWKEFGQDLLRKSIAGFPEWYKEQVMVNAFTKRS